MLCLVTTNAALVLPLLSSTIVPSLMEAAGVYFGRQPVNIKNANRIAAGTSCLVRFTVKTEWPALGCNAQSDDPMTQGLRHCPSECNRQNRLDNQGAKMELSDRPLVSVPVKIKPTQR